MPSASLTFKIGKDNVYNLYQKIIDGLPDDTILLLDDLAEIYKDNMDIEAPNLTGFLISMHVIEQLGTYDRYIYSEASYFDDVVSGHAVYGPIFSDLQRRWWFWYLQNVLGGEYENRTDGRQPGNDYPTRAYHNAQSAIDYRLHEYITNIGRT
ncbi:hypothetical protein [Methanobacterium spitsbergense]|uniref:Uncharacterized protein n=1 Tax=Methanobacterium spitsbergense TaxID=2874285 RepID=A0A8T5UTC7_9EURY|nr:hypothetical protein [Methanobacterium spitsbergense]MBZ2167008.1 hypothetical protein [Methanobacterium spitsbergense]